MSRKTPPFAPFPAWTTAKFFGFIRSGLREKFNRFPAKYQTLTDASHTIPVRDAEGMQLVYKSGKRQGEVKYTKVYSCASCKQRFKQKEVAVDHIVPAGQLKSFDDLGPFAERLFVGPEGLQVLCHPCHDIKTKEDKA